MVIRRQKSGLGAFISSDGSKRARDTEKGTALWSETVMEGLYDEHIAIACIYFLPSFVYLFLLCLALLRCALLATVRRKTKGSVQQR